MPRWVPFGSAGLLYWTRDCLAVTFLGVLHSLSEFIILCLTAGGDTAVCLAVMFISYVSHASLTTLAKYYVVSWILLGLTKNKNPANADLSDLHLQDDCSII